MDCDTNHQPKQCQDSEARGQDAVEGRAPAAEAARASSSSTVEYSRKDGSGNDETFIMKKESDDSASMPAAPPSSMLNQKTCLQTAQETQASQQPVVQRTAAMIEVQHQHQQQQDKNDSPAPVYPSHQHFAVPPPAKYHVFQKPAMQLGTAQMMRQQELQNRQLQCLAPLSQFMNKNNNPRRTKQLSSQTCPTIISEEDGFFCSPDIVSDQETAEKSASRCTNRDDDEDDDRSTLSDMTAENENSSRRKFQSLWSFCSQTRERWTAAGCLSSVVVLTIRLLLDMEPLAYVIHSCVVFVDMVLIHLFTNSVWLSVTGELLTIVFFLSFHFTNETVYELVETTLIAVICSLHMIHSRSKALDKIEHLAEIVEEMSARQSHSMRDPLADTANTEPKHFAIDIEGGCCVLRQGEEEESCSRIVFDGAPTQLELRKQSMTCGQHFFEHFLDGSAGVMYTSFVGLIISEIINYGNKSYQ